MKRWINVAVAGALVLVLSSCFALTGFVLVDSSLTPGQATKARFTVRPYVPGTDKFYQFFLIGQSSSPNIAVGKGTWGTNGTFGGPETMSVQSLFAAALDASGDCSGGGLDFGAVYATLTWKGFATVRKVGDGSVDKNAVVEVVVKAKAAAASETSVNVMGITGAWDDDGDGIPESSDDEFYCTGNATTNLYIK